MKKQSIITMAMVLGLIGSTTLPAQAAGTGCIGENTQLKGCVIANGKICSLEEIKNVLGENCELLQNGNWKECPIISFPNCNFPGNQINPDVPEDNDSEMETPEQDNSENNTPETETPDINLPNNSEPGGNESLPEIDYEQPETDNEELAYAKQVVKLVNEERAKASLSALELDTEIASAALIRANEITEVFSHTRPDGRSFSTVLTDYNIPFNGSGENIAWGQKTPEQVMEAWMNSDGHRANILNSKFTKIGVGHYKNAFGTSYWAQLFTY